MVDFQPGDEVLAPWGKDEFLYPAVLVLLEREVAHVAYLDGDEADVPVEALRQGVLGPGVVVNVNWKGRRTYYDATVRKRLAQAVLLDYEDGTQGWATVCQCRIRVSVLAALQTESRVCSFCGSSETENGTCRICGAQRRFQ